MVRYRLRNCVEVKGHWIHCRTWAFDGYNFVHYNLTNWEECVIKLATSHRSGFLNCRHIKEDVAESETLVGWHNVKSPLVLVAVVRTDAVIKKPALRFRIRIILRSLIRIKVKRGIRIRNTVNIKL
jgi:hypothetical protein